jgi:hypothetical protein
MYMNDDRVLKDRTSLDEQISSLNWRGNTRVASIYSVLPRTPSSSLSFISEDLQDTKYHIQFSHLPKVIMNEYIYVLYCLSLSI